MALRRDSEGSAIGQKYRYFLRDGRTNSIGKIDPLEKSCEKVTKTDARMATNPSSKRLEIKSPREIDKINKLKFFLLRDGCTVHTDCNGISCLRKDQSKNKLI